MLLVSMLGMLEVLVVLKELVVFVGGILEWVKSQSFFGEKIIESKKETFGTKKDIKIRKTKSKIHLDFRVVHSINPLSVNFFKAIFIRLEEHFP